MSQYLIVRSFLGIPRVLVPLKNQYITPGYDGPPATIRLQNIRCSRQKCSATSSITHERGKKDFLSGTKEYFHAASLSFCTQLLQQKAPVDPWINEEKSRLQCGDCPRQGWRNHNKLERTRHARFVFSLQTMNGFSAKHPSVSSARFPASTSPREPGMPDARSRYSLPSRPGMRSLAERLPGTCSNATWNERCQSACRAYRGQHVYRVNVVAISCQHSQATSGLLVSLL
ncbi:hypothetical protein RRG08_059183 [Elysia crispata]|uniref:Uncharacterized protein n=1 Tax=Elysia crispata TaxID=231223 RepID=A0AAE1DER8_9GAST|nr:hypothetical protein RRG08_059183 [Elysia crispata]